MKCLRLLLSVVLLTGTLGLNVPSVWTDDLVLPEHAFSEQDVAYSDDVLYSDDVSFTAPIGTEEQVMAPVVARSAGNYCHMKFPAIREETLDWSRPMLKDRTTGDLIDFYGPCDHDPLGKIEIVAQKAQLEREITADG